MADVFKKDNAISLLKGKHILFIGDSNIRALYKDLVWLTKINGLIGLEALKRRLEHSFLGDKLLKRSELTRGRDFTEHRIFENNGITIEFLFVTRCYCDNLVKLFDEIKDRKKHCPDVILMNSCLWDVSRWGPNGVNEYKVNMERLMKLIENSLPKHVLFIWGTALPIASSTSGGLIIKQIEFLQAILRIHVVEANAFASALVSSYEYDVLDFHYYMRYQIIRRSADGIHFLPSAMRFLTNLLLTHIALSWDVKLPGNLKTFLSPLATTVLEAIEPSSHNEVKQEIKKIGLIADTLSKTCSETPKGKKKKRKGQNKVLDVKPSTSDEPKFKVNQIENPNWFNPSRRTPPHYHKASIPFFNQISTSETVRTKIVSYNDEEALYSRQNNYNLPSYRSMSINNGHNLRKSVKDFRLIGFDDFNQCKNYENPDFINFQNNKLPNFSISVYNTNSDRFCNYQNHPYKVSRDPYGSRQTWQDEDDYQYACGPDYRHAPGPMRPRSSRYRYYRQCTQNWC